MTGYKSRFFRWNCGIKGCYYESLPDWDDLIECFPPPIRPTDIDGMVERRGHFLFLEQKSPGASLPEGQRVALKGLCQLPCVTAVIFRPAKASDLEHLECLVYSAAEPLLPGWEPYDGFRPHGREEFRHWLREWVRRAELHPNFPDVGGEVA